MSEIPESKGNAFASAVAALAHAMSTEAATNRRDMAFDPGQTAALRRLDPACPTHAAFWYGLEKFVVPKFTERPSIASEPAWALLMRAMALMAPDPHQPGENAGAVLAEVGYSELRLERLLRARSVDELTRPLTEAARFLRAKGRSIDWVHLAPIVTARADGETAEKARRSIARAYFAQLHSKQSGGRGDAA